LGRDALAKMVTFKPEKYGKYLLFERIACGGMAELYRAKIIGAQGFEKIVAIKKILPHLVDQEEFVKAFVDEARLAAFLQHPNIVQIYDFGEMAGSYFISMEYLSGVDLKTVLKKAQEKSRPLKLALSLFYILPHICQGLQYAHNLKDFSGEPLHLIHRDLGPQNILITYNGEIKLIDFGIAKASSHDATTYVGSLKGKLAYMSPEQASGSQIDHRSDLFTLGILLYELATGHPLYSGESQVILLKAGKAEFTPPEQVKQGLPATLYAVINKALHKNPDLRYQSAEQMRLDLEVCAQELAVRVSRGQMAAYMHELFQDKAAEEEKALKAAGLALMPLAAAPLPRPQASPRRQEEDKTVVLAPAARREGTPKILRAMALLLLVVGLGLFLLAASFTGPVGQQVQSLLSGGREQIAGIFGARQGQGISGLAPNGPDTDMGGDPHQEALTYFEALQKDAEQGQGRPLDLDTLQRHAGYLEEKYPQEVVAVLTTLAKSHPQVALVPFYLGKVYAGRSDSRQAIAFYRQALTLDPKLAEAYFNLGYLYASAGKYDQAEEMYAQVVSLAPSYLDEALVNLAVTQRRQDKKVESVHSLQQALQVNPGNQLAVKKMSQWQE